MHSDGISLRSGSYFKLNYINRLTILIIQLHNSADQRTAAKVIYH